MHTIILKFKTSNMKTWRRQTTLIPALRHPHAVLARSGLRNSAKVVTKAVNVSCKQARAGNCERFLKVPVCFIFSISALFPNYLAVHLVSYLDRRLSPGSSTAVRVSSLCVYLQARPRWGSGSDRVHMWWVILARWLWWHAGARARHMVGNTWLQAIRGSLWSLIM